uniref:ATP-binding cassette domain-containing protein n=1 Tax=Enterocloster clostridioformis TaxID=1531 RepID=UPI0026F04DA4|nr:ATP-binding cassette domain-containing protein [Enterocloster clostridioformis]
MNEILKAEKLIKTYGKSIAVNEVSLTVRQGDIYGLIEKNGAGKTTFMRMILGLASPDSGQMELFGKTDLEQQRKHIGSLIEAPGGYSSMCARDNLEIIRRNLGISNRAITDDMLRLVGLESDGKKKVKHFSMGMRQRLGLAIALMKKPAFLILDEPINGLDPSGIKGIRDLLLKLNQEEHVTILISSHILGELSKIATRYGILRDGVLIEERDAEQVDAACRQYLRLRVDDAQKTAAVLTEKLCVPCTVVNFHTVCVYERLDATKEINRVVVTSGIGLKESRFAGEDLEGYFMERMDRSSVQEGGVHA